MAGLLYRIGRFAARRAWTVIVAWLVILAGVGTGFAFGFGGLSTSFDIPNTASGAVTDELAKKLPDYSGAAGTVVFSTAEGGAFTSAQRSAISSAIKSGQDLPHVSQVNDPFASEKERSDRQKQLGEGRTKIVEGRAQIAEGQRQLAGAKTQLDAAQAQLDAGRARAEAAGQPTNQLDAQQHQLDAQRATLVAQQKKTDDSAAELDSQSRKLELGAQLLDYAKGIHVVSDDGSAALANVAFTLPRLELPEASKQAVIEHFTAHRIRGVDVSFSTDIAQGVPEIVGVGEAIGVGMAAVVLLVMLGSIIAAVFPLVTAILGVAIGALSTLAFSGVIQMASVTPVLGVMLGLAVGIDYSLFIINRHRRQLLQGAEVVDSIGLANGTAGNAVVFAGTTVIVALAALNITGIPFLGLMGTVGAIGVAIAVLIAVTLTPALLGLAGMRLLSGRARRRITEAAPEPRSTVTKPMSTLRAIITTVIAVAALLTIAVPALSMRVGLPDGSTEAVGSYAYNAFEVTRSEFGAGTNGALLVTAELPAGLDDDQVLQRQVDVAKKLSAQDSVNAVAPIDVSKDKRLAAFQVVPDEGPSSISTDRLVRDLRALGPVDGDMTLGVAGQAAINIDISESINDVLPLYLLVVVGLSVLIMIVVFRSLIVPLIATGGFILSLFANYGALVAVFQWGWLSNIFGVHSPGPILSFLPIILIGILFGLAMDYQLFLATGMREAYVHGASARVAVMRGFRAGRSVVLAAGLIMVAVFAGFVTSESTIIRSLGFGLAFGVLVDAFVVRMLLMPALMHLLGRTAWWFPRWLDRILPNVDVEGAKLEREHRAD